MGASANLKYLVIVESPNKCEKIKGYLDSEYPGQYEVMASAGHIRDLGKGGFEDLGYTVPDFKGIYAISESKKNIAIKLKNTAQRVDKVFLATDLDREGEGISWHLKVLLGLKDADYERVTFGEITKNEIIKAIQNPRKIDMHLVAAQETRRLLDRCIGWGLHQVVHDAVRFTSSVGRVQTPALRLIVEKEIDIRDFKPTDYYELFSNFDKGWSAKWDPKAGESKNHSWFGPGQEYITDKAMVEELKTKITDLTVTSIKNKQSPSAPAKPFITSTLQKTAFTQLGMYPADTMKYAQKLFEDGHITYHRTDSPNLSDEAIEEIKAYGRKEDIVVVGRKWQAGASAQEAHEAIRPTSIFNTQIQFSDPKEKQLYDLIWNRTLCSQLEEATYDVREVRMEKEVYVTINGELEQRTAQFVARARKLISKGWLQFTESQKIDLSDEEKDKEEKDEEAALFNNPIPDDLKEGDVIKPLEVQMKSRRTTTPKRYNQASLVSALEKLGIGRPSTYATILAKLYEREFIGEKKQKIHANPNGIKLIETIKDQFSFVNYDYTAKMEKALDTIASGKANWLEIMSDIHKQTIEVEREIFQRNVLASIPLHKCTEPNCNGRMMPRLYVRTDSKTKQPFERAYWRCNNKGCGQSVPDNNGEPGIRWKKTQTAHTCLKCETHKLILIEGKDDEGKDRAYYRCAGSLDNSKPKCGEHFDYIPETGEPNFEKWRRDHTHKCLECDGYIRFRSGNREGTQWTAFICENISRKKNPCKSYYPVAANGTEPDYEAYKAKKAAAPKEEIVDGHTASCTGSRCSGELKLYKMFSKKNNSDYFMWKCGKCNRRYWNNEDNTVGKEIADRK